MTTATTVHIEMMPSLWRGATAQSCPVYPNLKGFSGFLEMPKRNAAEAQLCLDDASDAAALALQHAQLTSTMPAELTSTHFSGNAIECARMLLGCELVRTTSTGVLLRGIHRTPSDHTAGCSVALSHCRGLNL